MAYFSMHCILYLVIVLPHRIVYTRDGRLCHCAFKENFLVFLFCLKVNIEAMTMHCDTVIYVKYCLSNFYLTRGQLMNLNDVDQQLL